MDELIIIVLLFGGVIVASWFALLFGLMFGSLYLKLKKVWNILD